MTLRPAMTRKAESIVRVPRSGGSGLAALHPDRRSAAATGRERTRRAGAHDDFSTSSSRRAFANRIWAELMGFGIVEPVDDFDLARYDRNKPPPAPGRCSRRIPSCWMRWPKDFQRHRTTASGSSSARIMKSSAYQLSSSFDGEWKETYAPYYARKYVRMLSAAELHDAIALATGRPADLSQRQREGRHGACRCRSRRRPASRVQGFMQSLRPIQPRRHAEEDAAFAPCRPCC